VSWQLNGACAYEALAVTGVYRAEAEDFCVTELPAFECAGEGEHLYLYIEKKNTNTQWLAKQLASHVGVAESDVSYAGLKDRKAVTQQWFSIYWGLKKPAPNYAAFEQETGAKILQETRHTKKLRRGDLQGNAFTLKLTGLEGDLSALDSRLRLIFNQGVPNYFGPQRFGFDGQNLDRAFSMFERKRKERNRQKYGLYLSAARSYLFNWVLDQRIQQGQWQTPLIGDHFNLQVSAQNKESGLDQGAESQQNRLFPKDPEFTITGPLWGRGRSPVTAEAQALEDEMQQQFPVFCDGLEHGGLSQDRRMLTSFLYNGQSYWEQNTLILSFTLAAGCYATAVLKELGQISEPKQEEGL
jgi:tRNA pseudouridine13 synthase